ncbi:MAG: glycosyltransferase family 2 protein [Rhodothermales bacterium]|nr:glycosyltransferase family 2 protein [Rhodothermales bacterium]
MNPIRFSLVTVTYQAAATLERTLRSVLRQSPPHDIEYWIVDGGSTDDTLAIVKRHEARLAGWTSEPDRGIYDAMNKGIARATGDWVGIVNADDWLAPDALDAVAEAVREAPDAGVVVGGLVRVTEDGEMGTHVPPPARFSCLQPNNHPATFVRRDVYERLGVFNLAYPISADLEFILRAQRSAAVRILTTPHTLAYMTSGGASYGFRGMLESVAIEHVYAGPISAARLLARKSIQKGRAMALKHLLPARTFKRLQQAWWSQRHASAYRLSDDERIF